MLHQLMRSPSCERRNRMADQPKKNPHLPSETIREILLWLPVKSLCRFRCVSKPWRSLISDPVFVKTHFNKANENDDVLYQRRSVMFTNSEHMSIYSLDLDEFLHSNDAFLDYVDNYNDIDKVDYDDDGVVAVATELDYVYSELKSNRVHFMLYCNGLLLCQLHYWKLYLVNPATRESKKLPEPPNPYVHEEYYFDLRGFGFDHSADDYKVVSGRCFENGILFSVYSLKTGSWRVIERRFPYKCEYLIHWDGILLNGGLHWLVRRAGSKKSVVIMCFLLAEEEVRQIQVPPDPNIKVKQHLLGVFRECLCITHCADGRTHNEFWVMKQYGVRETWTKIRISIPYSVLLHSGFWKKNHDLLVFKDCLVMYNFDEESFRNLPIRGFPKVGPVKIYLESLVSPNYYPIIDQEHQA